MFNIKKKIASGIIILFLPDTIYMLRLRLNQVLGKILHHAAHAAHTAHTASRRHWRHIRLLLRFFSNHSLCGE
jgi:hypothetical protein